jgi:hypothetical protein
MNKTNQRTTQQIGVCHPHSRHASHELTITLVGDDGQWSTTIDANTKSDAPSQFWIIELPAKARKPGGEMHQISNMETEFVVRLIGSTGPAIIRNLTNSPQKNWMVTMFKTFAKIPAIGVLVSRGHMSVTLFEG